MVADLVRGLVLAIVGRVFLHSVIREMYQPIVPLVDIEVLARCAKVSFLIEVATDEPCISMA